MVLGNSSKENLETRDAMFSMGFSREMVEKVILERGEDVPQDVLMEYLLYLQDKQDREASTSQSSPRNKGINTLDKLTTEFQFPSTAVEKAMTRLSE